MISTKKKVLIFILIIIGVAAVVIVIQNKNHETAGNGPVSYTHLYERKLQYPINIKNPNPAMAKFIITQYLSLIHIYRFGIKFISTVRGVGYVIKED